MALLPGITVGAVKLRRNPTVFVTGANGFLGRHLERVPAAAKFQLIAPRSRSLDIRHHDRVIDAITGWKPDAVIHLAYRRDDRRTIVDGSRSVAEAAAKCSARLIHLSTDVVFPGRDQPYRETDEPFPLSDYGRQKAEAEAAVMAAHPTAVVVRTSLMYGTDIASIPQQDVARSLAGQSTMRFFVDEFRCPAHASDVASACAALVTMPEVSGALHIAGPQAISRADFARAIAQWSGADPRRVPTASLADVAPARPGRIALDTTRAQHLGLRCRPINEVFNLQGSTDFSRERR